MSVSKQKYFKRLEINEKTLKLLETCSCTQLAVSGNALHLFLDGNVMKFMIKNHNFLSNVAVFIESFCAEAPIHTYCDFAGNRRYADKACFLTRMNKFNPFSFLNMFFSSQRSYIIF